MARESQLHFAKWAENLGIDAARHSESIYRNRESRSRRKSGVFAREKFYFWRFFQFFLIKSANLAGGGSAPTPPSRRFGIPIAGRAIDRSFWQLE